MSADAVAVNGAGSGTQNLLASARTAVFVRPVGVPGRDGLGRMELFYDGERYFAKDSRGTQYPLSYGVSEDEAVQQIRNTLGGSGYAHASGRSSGATGALSASRPSAAQNRAEAAASSETAALANAVTAQRTATHPNHGSEHVSALKNALAGYASGRLSGTDLRIALRAASQALGDPKALGTESRRYLEDFYRQGEPKLRTADAQAQAKAQAAAQARRQAAEAGDAAVKTLGNAIGQFDRSGRSGPARSELNAALAGARAADKTGWSPATRAQFQKWDQQASQRLWSAPAKAAAAKPATPGTTTSAPSLEFFGAPQGTAVYDAGSGLEIGRVLIGRSGLGWQIQFDNRGQGAAKTHNLDFDALWKDKHGAEFPKTRQDVARWVFKAFGNQSQFTRADLYPAYGHQRSVFDPQQTRNNLAGMDDLAQAATRSAQRPSSPLGSAEKPFTVATPEAPRISQSTKENIDGLAYASALGLAVRDFRQGRINGEQLRQMVSAAQTRYDAYQSRYTDPRIKANHLAYFEQAQRALQDEAALGSKLLFKGDSAKGIVALDKAVADYRAHPSHENWMKLQNSQSAAGQGSLKDAWSPKTREAFATLQQQASQLLRERKLTQQGMAAIDRDGQRLQIALWQEQKVQGGRWVTSGYVAQGPFVSDLRTGQLLPNQSKPEQQTMLHDAQGRNVMTRQAAHASAMKLINSGRLSGWNPTPDQVSMAKVKADMARQQIKPVSGSMAVRFEVAAADRAFKASGTNALNSSAFDAKAFSYAVVNNPVINQAAQQVQNFAPNPVTRALLDFSRSDLRAEQRRLTAQSEYVPDGGLLVKGAGVAGSLVGGLPLSLPPNIPTLGGYGATAYVQREILENPGINIAGAYATQQALGLVPNGKYLATTVLKQGGAQLLGDLSSQTFFGTTAKSPEELITGAITTSAISGVTGSRAKLDAGPQINRGQRLQRGVTAPDEAMRELRGGKRSDKQVDVLPAIPRPSLDVSQSPRSTISVTDTTPNKPPYSALPDTRSRPTLAAKPTITRAQSLLVTQRPSPEPTRVEVPPPGKPAASRQTSRSDTLPPMRRIEADRVGALNVAAFVDEQNLKPDAINQKSLVGEWQKAEVKEVRIDPNTGAIVAVAFGHISSNNSALGVLDRVAVAPAYRQHGIARGLIESVETGLADRGATKVKIQAAADSATPEAYLKGYYESLGYVQMANGFLEKPLQSPARGSPQQPRNGDAAPPSQTTPSAQQPIKPRAVASPLEPGLLIEIATSTGVSEGWLAGPTAVRQTNSGPVYRATRTFERDVSWEAIQALQKTQPNTTIKGLNPNNAWSSQASRDVRIELPQASGSGTVLWQVRGPSADGRGLSLVREEIKHFKLQADGRATEVTALGATPGKTGEGSPDSFERVQVLGLNASDPRGEDVSWRDLLKQAGVQQTLTPLQQRIADDNGLHMSLNETPAGGDGRQPQSPPGPGMVLGLRFLDGYRAAESGVVQGWKWGVTAPTAALDGLTRGVGNVLQPIGRFARPVTDRLGNALNLPATAYRWGMREARYNPITWQWDKFSAMVRQDKYPALRSELEAFKDTLFGKAARSVRYYDGMLARAEKARDGVGRVGQDINLQLRRLDEARREGNALAARDALKQLDTLRARLAVHRQSLIKPLEKLQKALDTQTRVGQQQNVWRGFVEAERAKALQTALQRTDGVQTKEVLRAQADMGEAEKPKQAAAAVADARRRVEEIRAGTPLDLDLLNAALRTYEDAKTELSKYTLAGNDSRVDVRIDRDGDLTAQLRQLQDSSDWIKSTLDALRLQTRASRPRDVALEAARTLTVLEDVRNSFSDATGTARAKQSALPELRSVAPDDKAVSRTVVDAVAAQSALSAGLAQVGYAHHQIKGIAGPKGRLAQLANQGKVEAVERRIAELEREVGQWSERLTGNQQAWNALQQRTDAPAQREMAALDGQRSRLTRQLQQSQKLLEVERSNLRLEQRAAEPRGMNVRLDDAKKLFGKSEQVLANLVARYEKLQQVRSNKIASLERQLSSDTLSTSQRTKLDKALERQRELLQANNQAKQLAELNHASSKRLLEDGQRMIDDAARSDAGLTPGKALRNAVRATKVGARLGAALTLSMWTSGQLKADTPQQIASILKQNNLPGGEAALVSAKRVEAVSTLVGPDFELPIDGLTELITVQGPVYAWRVRGPVSDVMFVAKARPQGRGVVFAPALNAGQAKGSLSPSVQRGSEGFYLTLDSQRIDVASLTVSTVFHPPGTNALNWWSTTKVEAGALGTALRFNTKGTNPKTKEKLGMIEAVVSNPVRAFFLPQRLFRVVPLDWAGVSITTKSSIGLGNLSLLYDADQGVGQRSGRTVWAEGKVQLDGKRSGAVHPGTQPYGPEGTAIRIDPNYYAINDPANYVGTGDKRVPRDPWLQNTEAARNVFELVTGKAAFKELDKSLTGLFQDWVQRRQPTPQAPKQQQQSPPQATPPSQLRSPQQPSSDVPTTQPKAQKAKPSAQAPANELPPEERATPSASQLPADDAPASGVPPPRSRTMSADGVPPQRSTVQPVDRPALQMPSSDGTRTITGLPPVDAGKGFIMAVDFSGSTPKVGAMYASDSTVNGQAPPLLIRAETRHGGHATVIDALFRQSIEQPGGTARIVGAHAVPLADGSLQMKFRSHSINLYEKSIRYGDERAEKTIADRFTYGRQATPDVARLTAQAVADATGQTVRYGEPGPNDTAGAEIVLAPRRAGRLLSSGELVPSGSAVTGITQLTRRSVVELQELNATPAGPAAEPLGQPTGFRYFEVAFLDAKGVQRQDGRIPVIDFGYGKNLVTLIEGDALSTRPVPQSRSLHGYAAAFRASIGPAIVVQAHGRTQGLQLGAGGSATRGAAGPTLTPQQLTSMVEAIDKNGTRPVCLNSCLTGAEGESFAKAFSALNPQRVVYAPHARVDVLEATFGDLSRFNRFENGRLLGPARPDASTEPQTAPSGQSQPATPTVSSAALNKTETDVARMLASGASFAEISSQLFLTPKTLYPMVDAAVKRLGVDARPAAAALIAATHQLGLIEADPTILTRAHAVLRIHADVGKEISLQDRRTTVTFDVLEGWLDGKSRNELQSKFNLNADQMQAIVQAWRGRLGLEKVSGRHGNYEAEVAQIVQRVTQRGYYAPVEPGKPVLEGSSGAAIGQPVRALEPATLPRRVELAATQLNTIRLLASGLSYTQISAVTRRSTDQLHKDVGSALREGFGIAPPAGAADAIVAAHRTGLVKAEASTLQRAEATIAEREGRSKAS